MLSGADGTMNAECDRSLMVGSDSRFDYHRGVISAPWNPGYVAFGYHSGNNCEGGHRHVFAPTPTTILDAVGQDFFVSPGLPLDSGLAQRQLQSAAVLYGVHDHGEMHDAPLFESLYPLIFRLLLHLHSLVIPFCHSFAAITLGSLTRLLFFGCSLRGGQRNFDPLLRSARTLCRGASFAFLITAYLMPVVHGAPTGSGTAHDALSANLVDPILEEYFAHLADERTRCVEHNAAMTASPDFERPPPEPGEQDFVPDVNEVVRECCVALRIMMFQRSDYFINMWVCNDTTPEEVRTRVRVALARESGLFSVCEAAPQLPDDVITMVVTPSWWTRVEKVGIVFDQTAVGGEAFVAAVPCSCTLTDVFVAFGSPPPDGMVFFLQNSSVPLPRQGRFPVPAGSLIRLRNAATQRVEVPFLAEALSDLYWARDLNVRGFPAVGVPDGLSLIIAPEAAQIIRVQHELTVPLLHRQACGAMEVDAEQFSMTLGRRHMTNFSYNGSPLERLIALVPKDWLHTNPGQTGVFLDAREIGEPISFHVFSTNAIKAMDVAEALELQLPHDISLRITGTDAPANEEGTFRITTGDILVVHAVDDGGAVCSEEATSTTTSESLFCTPWARPFYITAAIYTRQRSTHYLRVSVLPEDDAASLVAEIDDSYYEHDHFRFLRVVCPQPSSGYVSVITDTHWTQLAGLIPVLIDMTVVLGHRFATFIKSAFCLEDLACS